MVREDGDSKTGSEEIETEPPRAEGVDRASNTDGEAPDLPFPWTTLDDDTPGRTVERDEADPERFEDLKFVGPKTGAILRDSDLSLSDLANQRVAYRELTAAGVNPGVAARIRREHSLSWSFESSGDDLEQRSDQIRGLNDEERAWIADSSGWADRIGEREDAENEKSSGSQGVASDSRE